MIISQGSVAVHLKCGKLSNKLLNKNLLPSLPKLEFF